MESFPAPELDSTNWKSYQFFTHPSFLLPVSIMVSDPPKALGPGRALIQGVLFRIEAPHHVPCPENVAMSNHLPLFRIQNSPRGIDMTVGRRNQSFDSGAEKEATQ